MGKWRTTTISEIASVKMGQSPDGNSVNDLEQGMPFLQGNAEFGKINPSEIYWCTNPIKVADTGDLLVSVRAPVGEINPADKQYCIGRGLSAINFWGVDSEFARYAFSMNVLQLHIKSQGTTFLAVSKNDIDDIILHYPADQTEQRKIAEMLTAIDERIQTERDYLAKLQEIKKGLMQDLLTNTVSVDVLLKKGEG
jgi:type I restriction enzyme S subunit